jgi:hypothetical protein
MPRISQCRQILWVQFAILVVGVGHANAQTVRIVQTWDKGVNWIDRNINPIGRPNLAAFDACIKNPFATSAHSAGAASATSTAAPGDNVALSSSCPAPFWNLSSAVVTSFTNQLHDEGQLVVACFGANGELGDSCEITQIHFGKYGSAEVVSPDDVVVAIQQNGFWSRPFRMIAREIDLHHGENLKVRVVRRTPRDYYIQRDDSWSLPGLTGFQLPFIAYGGVKTQAGWEFSLLFPAIAFGGRLNFDKDFRYLGVGALAALSIVETVQDQSDGGESERVSAFTLRRLALTGYIDFAGYVWIGAGIRRDFATGANDPLILGTLGEEVYKFVFGL